MKYRKLFDETTQDIRSNRRGQESTEETNVTLEETNGKITHK